ncbi:hypothetical protein BJF86_04185 [Serinicoccus sp. CNJ-927]|nr:hypothetical protein BJF86_04185 [Serinicoccus sp. CNJ-927]
MDNFCGGAADLPSLDTEPDAPGPDRQGGAQMAEVVRVDGDQLAAAAQQQDGAGAALEDLADGVARVLTMVAHGAGEGALAQAAQAVTGRWRGGLHELGQQGRSLARATRQAREDYLLVERLLSGGWRAHGPAGWTP